MSVFRWRREEQSASSQSTPVQPNSAKPGKTAPSEPAPMRVPPHVERALITLTTKMQECAGRLDTIEHRLDELFELTINTPSHADVMEVRMHSAKLAAEMARATVELRGEIGMASEEARRTARLARSLAEDEPPVSLPVDVDLTESTATDLRAYSDDEEADTNGKGWTASA